MDLEPEGDLKESENLVQVGFRFVS